MEEEGVNVLQGVGEMMAAVVVVEGCQNVCGDDGINAGSCTVEVCLRRDQ
jgi:hypothetical protein